MEASSKAVIPYNLLDTFHEMIQESLHLQLGIHLLFLARDVSVVDVTVLITFPLLQTK